jgi:hypothetical protein
MEQLIKQAWVSMVEKQARITPGSHMYKWLQKTMGTGQKSRTMRQWTARERAIKAVGKRRDALSASMDSRMNRINEIGPAGPLTAASSELEKHRSAVGRMWNIRKNMSDNLNMALRLG